jgi:hypothetical protein
MIDFLVILKCYHDFSDCPILRVLLVPYSDEVSSDQSRLILRQLHPALLIIAAKAAID